jgi:hypothetical protein
MRSKTWWLVCLLLLGPRSAEATFIFTYELRPTIHPEEGVSFSVLSERIEGFAQVFVGHPDLVSLTPPLACQSFDMFTVVSYVRIPDNPLEGTRIEGFARCNLAIWGILTVFDERFDHLGTYTKGVATLTIAEVPEPATWLLSGLGLALLRLRRARR